jgi:diaminopimelate epimerase
MVDPKILREDIDEDGERWWLIDSGVPHLVAIREDIEVFDLEQARELRQKYNANVNICKVDNDVMHVRTYERGVENETLACGTGMVACFIRNHKEGKVSNQIKVHPKSEDELYISYENGIYRFGGKVTKTFVAETIE